MDMRVSLFLFYTFLEKSPQHWLLFPAVLSFPKALPALYPRLIHLVKLLLSYSYYFCVIEST
jgi:hypothetical protein